MEELTAALATSFSVSSDPNSTAAPHPRFAEYKKKTSNADQDARRREILEQQKNRRFDYANHARRVVDDVWDSADDLDDDDGQEAMDESQAPVKRAYKPGRYYRNQLMLSEWMVDVPDDFEEDWLMVMCPWGKRCLIVSARGATTAYGRNGYRVNSFPSHLPGGNRHQKGRYKENAILDCIYHEIEKTFYVLDIMNWKDNPVYDSDTDFRYFWMMSKMQEIPEAGEAGKLNPYKFVPLQYHKCERQSLGELFKGTTEQFDGCLFYHKQAHYTFGSSPLVVWLKPYMVGEMLGIDIPESMLQQKPANYSTYAAHMEEVREKKERFAKEKEERKAQRKQKRGPDRSRQFKMDLMESKWFTGTPEDFETDWCAIACPIGKRCLVMAIDGETKTFSKKGFRIPGYFLSVLPGGNGTEYGFGPTVVTLLDCVYHEEMMTYFILDCIMWASNDVKDYPYEDRMKFVRREISKGPEFKYITDLNMYKFVPLYLYDCSIGGIDLCLRQSTFEIDGLLFFKKDVKYRSGTTEEILWIKPYILPDVFDGIAVPKRLMAEKPTSYTDFEKFVDDVNNDRIKSKKKKTKKSKDFILNVKLNLPPQMEGTRKESNKKKNKQGQSQGQGHRQGMNTNRGGNALRGRGGKQNSNYSQLVAGGDASQSKPVYGKGKVTGYSYYGDERDYYYGDAGYGSDVRGRRDRGNEHDHYRMMEMESSFQYNNYTSRRHSNNKGRQYHLF